MASASTVPTRLEALRNDVTDTNYNAWQTPPMSYGAGTSPTTDEELARVVRALGLTHGKRGGEYRIAPRDASPSTASSRARAESAAYYTTDRADAMNTARAMAVDAEHRNVAARRASCFTAIVEDMDAEQLAAFNVNQFLVPHVDVRGIVAAERARRASVVARMDAARTFGALRESHVLNVVLVARDGLTMSAQVTTPVDPRGGIDSSGWDVAAEWVLNWRRMVPPVFAVVASQDGAWFARYDVDRDGTLCPAPAQKAVR